MNRREDGFPEGVVRLALEAMATRFELVLHGDDPVRLRAAGEEGLREIERLENVLSFYRPAGALGALNRTPAHIPTRVPPALFEVLAHARRLWEATGGAFDPTIGPLMTCWGLAGGVARRPPPDRLEEARSRCGFGLVRLDTASRTVEFLAQGMSVDLGGIAKGYAIDEAIALLADASVPGALLHGGTSTVAALGSAPDGAPWRIGIPRPGPPTRSAAYPETLLCTVDLESSSLSVSEVRGKGFFEGDEFFGHVLDPLTGHPTRGAELSAVRTVAAVDSDALATALLVLGPAAQRLAAFDSPAIDYLVATAHGHSISGRGLFSGIDVR